MMHVRKSPQQSTENAAGASGAGGGKGGTGGRPRVSFAKKNIRHEFQTDPPEEEEQ